MRKVPKQGCQIWADMRSPRVKSGCILTFQIVFVNNLIKQTVKVTEIHVCFFEFGLQGTYDQVLQIQQRPYSTRCNNLFTKNRRNVDIGNLAHLVNSCHKKLHKEKVWQIIYNEGGIYELSFNAFATKLAVGFYDGRIKVIDLKSET